MDDAELQLERDKFEFEKEKWKTEAKGSAENLDFERERYRAEADRRAEDLEKIRAERRKIDLDTEDLKVPYKDRPAYKTAVFQGIAVVLAVLSAIVSIGLYKPVFDAYEANRKASDAKKAEGDAEAAKADAIKAKDDAIRDKEDAVRDRDSAIQLNQAAQEQLTNAQSRIGPLQIEIDQRNRQLDAVNKQIAKAQQNALLAPIQEILASLTLDPQCRTSDLSCKQPRRDRLESAMHSNDSAEQQILGHYVQGFVLNSTNPVDARLAALSALYQTAKAQTPPDLINMADYRRQFIALATSSEAKPDFDSAWTELIEFLGKSMAGPYVCAGYDNMKWSTDDVSAEGINGYRINMINFIVLNFSSERACVDVFFDHLDTKVNDPYPTKHGRYLGTCRRRNLEVALLQCVKAGAFVTSSSFHLHLYSPGPPPLEGDIERHEKEPAETMPLVEGPQSLSLFKDFLSQTEATQSVNDWRSNNSELVDLFNEAGLKRLRTCSFELWDMYIHLKYISMTDIKQVCPTDTWPKPTPGTPGSPSDR